MTKGEQMAYREGEFNPEKSDGCTLIGKPYKWITGKDLSFKSCCIEHDRAYWYGGTRGQRRDADEALRDCVIDHGHLIIAWIMWTAVRIFGSPRSPFHFRWAHKFSIVEGMTRGYAAGTPKE